MPEPEPDLSLAAAGATDIGRIRKCNEDLVLLREDLGLYIVCDGAGGHDAGDIAAQIAVRSIARQIADFAAAPVSGFDAHGIAADARRLAVALHKANRDVLAVSRASGSKRGMGTTVVAALFSRPSSQLHLAHVGDSRCYRYRGGHLEALTLDHSVIRDLLEQRPDLGDDLIARLPKHAVTRALGMDAKLRISIASHEVVDGDRYLLCSDGLSGPVAAPAMAEVLARGDPPAETVGALLDLVQVAGAPDNVAIVVVDCHGPRTSELPISLGARPGSERDLGQSRASEPEILLLGIEELGLDELEAGDPAELSRLLDQLVKR